MPLWSKNVILKLPIDTMSKQEQIITRFLIQNGNNIHKHTQIGGQE